MGLTIAYKTGFDSDECDLGRVQCSPNKSTPTIGYSPTRMFGTCNATLCLSFSDQQSAETFAAFAADPSKPDASALVLGKTWYMQGEGVGKYEIEHGRSTEPGSILSADWTTHTVRLQRERKTSEDGSTPQPAGYDSIGVQFAPLPASNSKIKSCLALYNVTRVAASQAYSMTDTEEGPWQVVISYTGDLYGDKVRKVRKVRASDCHRAHVDDNILPLSDHTPCNTLSFDPAQQSLAQAAYLPYDPYALITTQYPEAGHIIPNGLQQQAFFQPSQDPNLASNLYDPRQYFQGTDGFLYPW